MTESLGGRLCCLSVVSVVIVLTCRLLPLFLDANSGNGYKSPYIKNIKVRAYKLTPLSQNGILDLDGEV